MRGGAIVRITPDGRLDRRIELPVDAPTMPAFGGPDLATLFVTSIAAPDTPTTTVRGGDLLALDVGAQGRPEPVFAGS